MKSLANKLILLLSVSALFLVSSCNPPVYVTQSGQTYHDYTAVNHHKVVNKTKKPKIKKQKRNH
ncbi:MAG: hypothetical protein WBG62_05200 [Cyclobacteriaceae bacterium]